MGVSRHFRSASRGFQGVSGTCRAVLRAFHIDYGDFKSVPMRIWMFQERFKDFSEGVSGDSGRSGVHQRHFGDLRSVSIIQSSPKTSWNPPGRRSHGPLKDSRDLQVFLKPLATPEIPLRPPEKHPRTAETSLRPLEPPEATWDSLMSH